MSGSYWMSMVQHQEDDFTMYLYPVDVTAFGVWEPIAFAPEVQDRDPLASFTGPWVSVMEQLVAYQVQQVLS